MRQFFLLLLCIFSLDSTAQKAEHLIVITTDGFRWQEVFKGMDTSLANQPKYNEGDSAGLYSSYFSAEATQSRKKLLPFLWSVIAEKGQIYGNRLLGNKVNVANPYWFSYPGYSEIFTGFVDTAINTNEYRANPNSTVLAFLQNQQAFRGKVAAFTAWEAFNRILNEKNTGIPVVAAFDQSAAFNHTEKQQLIDQMLAESYKPFGMEECLDVFTHTAALNYLKEKKPSVLYISYGETDEWAHAGKYKSYLNAAHQVDQWIESIWNYIQQDPFYKNKTALLITTDHGRGDFYKNQWTSHGEKIKGADEIWMAMIGPGISAKGEQKIQQQLFQQQTAQTIAELLGLKFTATHPVAAAIPFK